MPSPFPGMDPYLEAHWRDVHQSLIIYIRDAIRPGLPSDLRPRVEERVFVQASFDESRTIYPDVSIIERHDHDHSGGGTLTVTDVAEPIIVLLEDDEISENFLEIREAGTGGRLITVIEVLSPSNRLPGPGRDQYLRKRTELQQGGVNFVELDLIRTGDWMLLIDKWRLANDLHTPNRACVWRAARPNCVEYYPFPLRQRLPSIRIPLRPTDEDVRLDLQPLINKCYENGGYDDIDYSVDCDPPLTGDDAEWSRALLTAAGLRSAKKQ
ncbi:MAG: DUF4058 family protein [Planctomycetaceae bacterium]